MRRAALYARVSTRHQEQEATIESQIDRLLTYAEAHGYELAPERQFVDQAISGIYLAALGWIACGTPLLPVNSTWC